MGRLCPVLTQAKSMAGDCAASARGLPLPTTDRKPGFTMCMSSGAAPRRACGALFGNRIQVDRCLFCAPVRNRRFSRGKEEGYEGA